MRIRSLALGLVVGLVGCSSEDPAPPPGGGVVDNHPGNLVITSPGRAAFIEGDQPVEVRGTGATPDLKINGASAEVAPDGSFHATLKPEPGLNLILAVDGESRLEAPFVYGHFEKPTTPVAQAVALDLGVDGIGAAPPAASLTSITNQVLKDQDLLAAVRGKTFEGSVVGAKWSYKVTDGKHAGLTVGMKPAAKGLGVDATLKEVVLDGDLTIRALGGSTTRPVRISAKTAKVAGEANLGVENGALRAAIPSAEASLDGFRYDSDNAGFPCCVDAIMTSVLKGKIEGEIRDAAREEIPKALELTLEGMGLPKELDLRAAGLKEPLAITTRFDGIDVDSGGGTLTASVLFGGPVNVKAPGWLKLGQPLEHRERAGSLGLSFSVDVINQLFFAAWGTGSLAITVPDVAPVSGLELSPALPPILAVKGDAVRVGLGEVIANGKLGSASFKAAITVMQDITPSTEEQALVLTAKGEPTVSITWLSADDVSDGMRNIVASAAKDQLQKFLKPIRLPFPSIALAKLGPSFEGQSLRMTTPKVAIANARIGVSGIATLAK